MDTFNFSNCNVTNNFYSKCCDKKLSECRDLLPEEYGIMHNELLAYLTKTCNARFVGKEIFAIEDILYVISEATKYMVEHYPSIKNSLYIESDIINKYVVDLGTDEETGESKLLYIFRDLYNFKSAVEKSLLSDSLKNDIVQLLTAAYSGEKDKKHYNEIWNNILTTDYGHADNYRILIMNAVNNASSEFWSKNKCSSIIGKERPPKGWTCEEWCALCDAIIGLVGLRTNGEAGKILAGIVSYLVSLDCEENPKS